MKTIISIIFLLTGLCIQNPDSKYPDFTNISYSQISENNEWKILTSVEGDLNKDSLVDLVLILESTDSIFEKRCESCDSLRNKARIILVLLQEADTHRVILQNNHFIARPDEGGMLSFLEPEISIKNHQLIISYEYTRGNIAYTFAYEKDDLVLLDARSAGVSGGYFESDHFDFTNKMILSESGSISDESTNTDTIPMNHIERFRKLSDMEIMYQWEVAEGKSL